MRLLLDECVPRPLKREFRGHDHSTIDEAGALLNKASTNFQVLVTVDKNIEYQQDTGDLPMAVMILSARSNRIENLLPLLPKARIALNDIRIGDLITIEL